MKRKILRIIINVFSFVVLAGGLSMIGYVSLKPALIKDKVVIQKLDITEVRENELKDFVVEEVEAVTEKDIFSHLINQNTDKTNYIATISMPSINTKAMITKGFTNETAFNSVGTMTENQKLGEGKYSLAGHNMFVDTVLFTNLKDLKINDLITINDEEYVYTYKVYSVIERLPVDDFNYDYENRDELLLYTCTNDAIKDNYKHRTVVRADYIKKEKIDKTNLKQGWL